MSAPDRLPPGAHLGGALRVRSGRPGRRRRGWSAWLPAGGAAALALFVGGALVGHFVWTSTAAAPGRGPSGGARYSAAPGSPAHARALARAVDPGLADVETSLSYLGERGAGTGLVVAPGGEVWTNNHVIEGATTIRVRDVGNGATYGAHVVGYDRSEDVAVLRLVGAEGLHTARLGTRTRTRAHLREGVVADGNAEGRGGAPSVAAGSVTATNQSIAASDAGNGGTEHLSGLIETNARVEPGDSGGALVGPGRKVIGMVTAASGSVRIRHASTQGFAIPIGTVARVARSIDRGDAAHGIHLGGTAFLGVIVLPPAAGRGARVHGVVTRGPAARAGLRAGDTITAVAGHSVASPGGLTRALLTLRPGARVRVSYDTPAGARRATVATLASGPPQ